MLSISCTGLEIADVDHISYHVLKFCILEDLDVSVNLSLDTGAINRIVSSFAGHFAHQRCYLEFPLCAFFPSDSHDCVQEKVLETAFTR